jgi:hypothetical protein
VNHRTANTTADNLRSSSWPWSETLRVGGNAGGGALVFGVAHVEVPE